MQIDGQSVHFINEPENRSIENIRQFGFDMMKVVIRY